MVIQLTKQNFYRSSTIVKKVLFNYQTIFDIFGIYFVNFNVFFQNTRPSVANQRTQCVPPKQVSTCEPEPETDLKDYQVRLPYFTYKNSSLKFTSNQNRFTNNKKIKSLSYCKQSRDNQMFFRLEHLIEFLSISRSSFVFIYGNTYLLFTNEYSFNDILQSYFRM